MRSLRHFTRLRPQLRSPIRTHWAWTWLEELWTQHPVVTVVGSAALALLGQRHIAKLNVRLEKDRTSQQSKVTPILERLRLPFDANKVLPVSYGCLFPRPNFEENLEKLLKNGVYAVYYGPSEYGKSTAVVHHKNIHLRCGVLYLSLRGAGDDIGRVLAAALGLGKDSDLRELLQCLHLAVTAFFEETGQRAVVIIEDPHGSMDLKQSTPSANFNAFAAFLVDLYNSGLINVLYTISDVRAESVLRSVSGHSGRLLAIPFPRIPDEEMVNLLWVYSKERTLELVGAPRKFVFTKLDEISKRILPPRGYDFVLDHRESAELIVSRFGCHLGSVVKCLQQVVDNNKTVQDAVGEVVQTAKPDLFRILYGDKALGVDDTNAFIVAAHHLFEALSNPTAPENAPESVPWNLVAKKEPGLGFKVLLQAVDELVMLNMLSYVDRSSVSFHSRVLKWAYLEVRKDENVQSSFKEAKGSLSK